MPLQLLKETGAAGDDSEHVFHLQPFQASQQREGAMLIDKFVEHFYQLGANDGDGGLSSILQHILGAIAPTPGDWLVILGCAISALPKDPIALFAHLRVVQKYASTGTSPAAGPSGMTWFTEYLRLLAFLSQFRSLQGKCNSAVILLHAFRIIQF